MTTTNNNTENKTKLSELHQAVKDGADIQTLRAKIEAEFRANHNKAIAQFSDEDLGLMIANATEFVNLAPLSEMTAERVADKVLFNVSDSRWYADKVVNIFTTALGVGAAVWAGNKLGIFPATRATSSDNSLFGDSSEDTQNNPFADTTPVKVSPRIGNSRPKSAAFDHQAS